jgi:serine/threonine-protein kinase
MSSDPVSGRYVIEGEIGRGASATVYRAMDSALDRPVAMKVISGALAADPEFTERFEREARLAARLDHPNIVTVHDVGVLPDGRAFIAMRLLEGVGLDRIISERAPLPVDEVSAITKQLAAALDYTHARGLIHRDVKPSNVVVDVSGRVTLTDFGIARALDSARVTLPGLTIGTPRYMSPEQVRGEDATAATDVYSLAVIAYEMLSGRPPFEGQGTGLMFKIVHEEPAPLMAYNPRLPAACVPVLNRGMAKLPGDRWPSAGAFADALAGALVRREQVTMISPRPPVDSGATMIAPGGLVPPGPVARAPVATSSVVPAAAQPQAVAPAPVPASAPASPPPAAPVARAGGGGRSRGVLYAVVGGGAAAVFLGAVAFALLNKGGGDDNTAPSGGDSATATRVDATRAAGAPTAIYTATPVYTATPAGKHAEITGITASGGAYVVQYTTNYQTPAEGDHVHFFFDTVKPAAAGVPGAGPWFVYYGPVPFIGYKTTDKPAGATKMCILVANPDHSVQQNTGNCWQLP